MDSVSSFRKTVLSDFLRYGRSASRRNLFYVYIVHPGFRVTFWYRVARHLHVKKFPRTLCKLATLWLLRQQLKTGVTLNPHTEIGPGLYIPHPGCIVVNPKCKIGKNLYLSHDVLLGKAHIGPRKGIPIVGDDDFIGSGARLLGKLTVGNNTAIGANAVVLSDIPADTFAAGAPAVVIKEMGARELLGYAPMH